jgi:hypothetical protein
LKLGRWLRHLLFEAREKFLDFLFAECACHAKPQIGRNTLLRLRAPRK